MLARDRHACAYCGRHATTVDHVLPQSRGGESTWLNAVAACAPCNHRKANRTPQQAGMSLVAAPRQPTYAAFALLGVLERHDVWQKYSYRPRDED